MDKRVDSIENDLSRVVWVELKGSLVGGKGELIICFQRIRRAAWLILRSWG